DRIGATQVLDPSEQPVQPGHPDVSDQLAAPAQVAGTQLRLPSHWQVRGARREGEHEAAGRRWWLRRPGEQPSIGVFRRLRQHGPHSSGLLGTGPGEQRGARTTGLAQPGGDRGELLDGLALAVHRLRVAPAAVPAGVQGRNRVRVQSGPRVGGVPGHGAGLGTGVPGAPVRPAFRIDMVNAPDWIPRRSTAAKRKPAPVTSSWIADRSAGVAARSISSGTSSIRAIWSWWRTRESLKPRRRSPASTSSTWCSFSAVTSWPCGMREARQGAAGLSAHGSAIARAIWRTTALLAPAS